MVQENRRQPDQKVLLLADGHVEGDFSKNRKKELQTKDCTEVKADKPTTISMRKTVRIIKDKRIHFA